MSMAVFAGPSISHRELSAMTDARILGPIKRGDLERFSDIDTFVIIDGEFGQNLSVSPKEILPLLEHGRSVIGASSMGALRASELDGDGMMGIGWVYDRFARAAVRRDDEVALTYSPIDFKATTVPLVNIEYWLELLVGRNRISARERARISRASRAIFFAERTEGRVMSLLRDTLGSKRLSRLLEETGGTIPDIKYIDAKLAVLTAIEIESRHADTVNDKTFNHGG